MKKLQLFCKRMSIVILCSIMIINTMLTYTTLVYADNSGSSGILGTNEALGSPILNNNFTIDNWNKWEMICWGVFLSNFCIPLVDDYESCFMTGKGGSEGSGYKALCFGSGNDPVNNETIQQLVTYAAVQQNVTQKEIWVGYSKIENGKYTGTIQDPNAAPDVSAVVRRARFKDFFFDSTEDASVDIGSTWGKLRGADVLGNFFDAAMGPLSGKEYTEVAVVKEGCVPTFYVKNANDTYVKLLDFRDSWDVQMMAALLNAVNDRGERTQDYSDYGKVFKDFWDNSSTVIYMDAFGNIVANGKMLFPAAVNKHIARDEDINLLNSWVMNSYSSTYSNKQLILGMRQDITNKIFGWDPYWKRQGGVPALGESDFSGIGLFYYDTDSMIKDKSKFGEIMSDLFKADIKNPKTKYPLEFEISDGLSEKYRKWFGLGSYHPEVFDNTRVMASLLTNINEEGTQGRRVLNTIKNMDGKEVPLYSENGLIVPIMLNTVKTNKINGTSAARMYYNFLYEAWTGKISAPGIEQRSMQDYLPLLTWDEFQNKAYRGFGEGGVLPAEGDWWAAFKKAYPEYAKVGFLETTDWFDANANDSVTAWANRLIKVYPVSDLMKAISQIFACRDGTEFRQYSTMVYVAYLNFYGIANSTSLTGAQTKLSKFNPEIYDESSDVLNADLNSIIDTTSSEEKETEILNMSYLMLHPEYGREYRQQIVEGAISTFILEQYNRIVYGGYNTVYKGSTSKSNSGFLNVESYSDNWLTSWFLKGYTGMAVWLMMGFILAAIIIGLIKSKKFSWFFVSVLVIVNTILVVPTTGDIVPYITSNMIQNMFMSKMTYWSVSQGITNAQLEKQTQTHEGYMKGMTTEEATTVLSFVKQLSVIYTDRSLMVKQDISQKITQKLDESYSNIQSIQSARWILPMIMQQFTGDNKTADYIYKPLANIWDDLSNMYWVFKPEDAAATDSASPTATSGQTGDSILTADTEDLYFALTNSGLITDYKVVSEMEDTINPKDINYRSYAYTMHGEPKEQVHIVFGYLHDATRIPLPRKFVFGEQAENYVNVDSWQDYIDALSATGVSTVIDKNRWATTRADDGFEITADSYTRLERSSITKDMPYLLMTENPIYYFYCLVKDTFDAQSTLGSVIGQLQGQIKEDENGNEVRANFMYATTGEEEVDPYFESRTVQYTGYVRDILDLEELFTNLIPYLYQMQLTAGGFDGVSGILGDDEITEEMQYYKGNKQSWMYRCNWATKLMENPDYSKEFEIGMPDGSKVTITNPMLSESYPDNRPMVFSEAQKIALGLQDKDLNMVELKCIEANKRVARQWTMMINYAGTAGLTKEVLMRQMATDATIIFCDEFSPSGLLHTIYAVYPQSLDLRYLSFDSIMKMLIMNVTKNTSYIYSDTMSTFIEETNMFTSGLLLVDAMLCAYIVPLMRSVLMALIFYLGIFAIFRSLLSSARYKSRVACGQLLMNLLFIGYTLIYYAIFSALMAITSTDEVLTQNSIQSTAGNPEWVLIAVLIGGILYGVAMGFHMKFCFQHRRDMGFEAMSMAASGIVSGISGALHSAGGAIQNFFNNDTNIKNDNSTSNTNSIKGTGSKDAPVTDVNIKQGDGQKVKLEKDDDAKENVLMDADYMSNYNTVSDIERNEYMKAAEIDAEIKAGEEMKVDE